MAVGADDNTEAIAFFSSRGPAPVTYQIKPEVVAPGVGIYSTVPYSGCQLCDPSGYLTLSGTSMASPHVAGAAALLLQAFPQWTPLQLKLALMERAQDLHQDVMTQGSGQVEVFASAASPILSSGGELSLGWDDLRQAIFASDQPLTVTNTTNAVEQITFNTQFNVPPGMQVVVTPSTLSLQPNQSSTVDFSFSVNNSITPNLPAQPFTYGGLIVATDASGASIHRPFALCKAPKITVTSDQVIDTMIVFHGADVPQIQPLFSQGPYEMLMPAGSYDFYFDLSGPVVPYLQSIVREKVAVNSLTNLSLSKAEAKNKIQINAIDHQGGPLNPDFNDLQSSLLYRAANFIIVNEVAGSPIKDSDYLYISDVSNAFKWDASMGGLPNDPGTPVYIFNASLDNGITQSKTFEFKPTQFNKTVLNHAARPDNSLLTPYNWFWLVHSSGWSGSGYSGNSAAVPFDQTIYSMPPGTSDAAGGYWSVDAIGENYTGNLPVWFVFGSNALY
ncbi:MAG: S8 family serine peptidase, partial [Terriglobales bacterium]